MPGVTQETTDKLRFRQTSPSAQRRKAFAAFDVGEPRVTHACVGVLSVAHKTAVGQSVPVGSTVWPKVKPASSKSLLEISPVGFDVDT